MPDTPTSAEKRSIGVIQRDGVRLLKYLDGHPAERLECIEPRTKMIVLITAICGLRWVNDIPPDEVRTMLNLMLDRFDPEVAPAMTEHLKPEPKH